MRLPIYQVDAFASRLFRGNPAAVVPLESWLPDETLQAIAAENNLSETAFFVPSKPGAGTDYDLRWFTPTMEVELCGHATLATGHVLRRHLGVAGARISFSSRSGPLRVGSDGERLVLDFPATKIRSARDAGAVAEALRAEPAEVLAAADGRRDMDNRMAVFATQREVERVRPDFDAVAAVGRGCVIVTAPGDEVDFVSRYFAPGAGIPEDPVTGSAHCMLAPYWAERLGREKLSARQLSARGGELECTVQGDRVLIAGRAVTYLVGSIEI